MADPILALEILPFIILVTLDINPISILLLEACSPLCTSCCIVLSGLPLVLIPSLMSKLGLSRISLLHSAFHKFAEICGSVWRLRWGL